MREKMKIKAGTSISIIGITVFLILMGAVSAVDAAVVRVEPASQPVSAGEDFSVDVYVDTVTELTADGAILHFDPAAMRATAVTEGITSGYPKFFTCEEIDNTTGLVTFTYGLSPGSSVSGSGPLATINFTADELTEGTYNLDLTDVELYDEIGPIPTEGIYNGTVIITGGPSPTPSPTPTTGGNGGDRIPRGTPEPTPTHTPVPTPTPTEEEKTYKNLTAGEEVTVEILDKKLTITFKKNVSGVKITAKEFVEKPADIPDAPGTVFKYLEYNIENVSAEDIEKATIPFDVPKSWIVSENIDPVTIRLNRYYEGAWNPLRTEKIGEDDENIHYSAETEGLSIFAITGEKKTEAVAPAPSIWVWGLVGAVLLIVVIAGVWYIKKKRK